MSKPYYKLWAASITFKGRYASIAEAVAAREKKEKELFDPILIAHGRKTKEEP